MALFTRTGLGFGVSGPVLGVTVENPIQLYWPASRCAQIYNSVYRISFGVIYAAEKSTLANAQLRRQRLIFRNLLKKVKFGGLGRGENAVSVHHLANLGTAIGIENYSRNARKYVSAWHLFVSFCFFSAFVYLSLEIKEPRHHRSACSTSLGKEWNGMGWMLGLGFWDLGSPRTLA